MFMLVGFFFSWHRIYELIEAPSYGTFFRLHVEKETWVLVVQWSPNECCWKKSWLVRVVGDAYNIYQMYWWCSVNSYLRKLRILTVCVTLTVSDIRFTAGKCFFPILENVNENFLVY